MKPNNSIKATVLNNRFKKRHITPRMIDKATESCNLIQLLIWWDEDNVSFINNQFCLKSNPKYKIFENMLYNFYTGEALPPIFALEDICGLSFQQAYYVLNHFALRVNKYDIQQYIKKNYINSTSSLKIEADVKNFNNILDEDLLNFSDVAIKGYALSRTYAYLCTQRKIDRDIISNFIHRRLLCMDKSYNLAFLTYRNNDVIAVTRKSTNTKSNFRQNFVVEHFTGFSYSSVNAKEYKNVYVFESCVDLMSYMSLAKIKAVPQIDYNDSLLISLNGANIKYLDKVLRENLTIENIYMCLDNDTFGIDATEKYIQNSSLNAESMQYLLRQASLRTVGYIKDWNDLLIFETNEIEHS